MNFLAHVYLSGNSKELMIGNFIGDSVKGKMIEKYSDEIIEGIKLHRKIDSFTDTHEIVRESKLRLRPKFRKYSGVIVDVFYDHFLAANWNEYANVPLPEYVQQLYDLLLENVEILPERTKRILPHMIAGNWLLNYSRIQGIEWALEGMAMRTRFKSNMEFAAKELERDYFKYKTEFKTFFPELKRYVDSLINCRNISSV